MAKPKKKADAIPPGKALRDKWINWIEAEENAHGPARLKMQKVVDRYRDEKRQTGARFNILWSNVQVLEGALYQATPKPDVRRRFLDPDPVSREAAAVIERGISFSVDSYDFDDTAKAVINDYLLPGYGQARVRYKPYFETKKVPAEEGEKFDGEDENGPYKTIEEIAYEEVYCEHIDWRDFRWDHTAKKWSNVKKCAIDQLLDRTELVNQFGDIGKKVKLTHGPKDNKDGDEEKTHALVHECFDKVRRKVIVVSPGYEDGPIAEWDDPLELKDFWPFPKPLFATQTSGKIMPLPDFNFYQDQADELDTVTERIDALVNQLKVRGVYDSGFEELVNVMKTGDGDLTPIKDFVARFGSDNGKIESVIAFMPLKEVAEVLAGLYQQRDQLKQTIYEITGIADIVRGQSNASETLGAQQLKGKFADMRLGTRRSAVNAFFRDLFRIKAEILAEKFQGDTLSLMTGVKVTPQMDQILKSDVLRAYKIDVETDSTMAVDEQEEQKSRTEALGALTIFLEKAIPAVQAGFLPKELAKELALFGIRGFKKARILEDVIERLGAADQQQNSPEAMQAQVAKLTQELQLAQQQLQEGQQMMAELQKKAEGKELEVQSRMVIEREKIASQERMHEKDLQAGLVKDQMNVQAKQQTESQKLEQQAQQSEQERSEKEEDTSMDDMREDIDTIAAAVANLMEKMDQVLSRLDKAA